MVVDDVGFVAAETEYSELAGAGPAGPASTPAIRAGARASSRASSSRRPGSSSRRAGGAVRRRPGDAVAGRARAQGRAVRADRPDARRSDPELRCGRRGRRAPDGGETWPRAYRRPGGCGARRCRRSGAASASRRRSALALISDLEIESEQAAGLATAAMICGFIAFDAPARVRVRWQLLCAPVVGLSAALGVLSSAHTSTAVLAMAAVACACGFLVAVSLRLAVAGLTVTLALVIAQGVLVSPGRRRRRVRLRARGRRRPGGDGGARVAGGRPRAGAGTVRAARARRDREAARRRAPPQRRVSPRAALRRRDGDRGRDLPARRVHRPRLLGAADDPVRAQAGGGPDHRADRDARRRHLLRPDPGDACWPSC